LIAGKKSIDPGKFLENANEMLRLNTCVLIQYLSSKFGQSPFQYWDTSVKQKLESLAKDDKDLKAKQVKPN